MISCLRAVFRQAIQWKKLKKRAGLVLEDGLEIPLPTDMAKHQQHADFQQGYVWAIVEIDISRYMGKAEKINVTLPSRLIHLIDSKVAHDSRYKSRSGFLAAGAELLLRG